MYEQRLAVLTIGLSGCHGDTVDGASITYYDSRLRAYYGEVVEGGFIIDKSKVLAKRPGLAITSPMCKGSMKPGTVDALGDVSDSFVANAIAQQNDLFGTMAKFAIATKGEFGGMDFVAPDLYASWWMNKGARIGTRTGDTVVWSDGVNESIPSFENRYR